MGRIAIVGAGQAGLQLALGLAGAGRAVTLVTDRSGEQIGEGRVLSTQCMFDDALQTERELGLDRWEADCPTIEGIRYSIGMPDGELALQFSGRLRGYAQSVDQRLKMSGWLEELEARGGEVDVRPVDVDLVERLAAENDLVVIASAKGPFARNLDAILPRDAARSPYAAPQRNLAVAYVRGYAPLDPPYFSISIVPGVGEYFVGSCLTLDGPCHTMCFEPIPGTEMDRWGDVALDDLDRHLATCVEVLERWFPWEAERCGDGLELTDPLGVLKGAITPVVRSAVGRLPSGAPVLGIGDAVVQNDPLVGQGANSAAKGSTAVLEEILGHPGALDETWMRRTGERYWEVVRFSTEFTNLMLNPPAHVPDMMGAGSESPAFADHLANATNDPATLFPWIRTPEGIRELAHDVATTSEEKV